VRVAALFLTLLLAGCGAAQENAARQPGAPPAKTRERPDSKVFTVPDELPPRESAGEHDEEVGHNPDTAPGAQPPSSPDAPAEGAPSDEDVRRDLAEALGVDGDQVIDQAGLTRGGLATVPPGAPPEVAAIINAANKVARAPYRYGGGHGGVGGDETWVDTAYDCSGSMSFAFAAAGLIDAPMASPGYMRWGKPGPGKWVTTFANEGHAFMVVAGLRFDTVERARTGTRWGQALRNVSGFVVRHPPGL
jgi:cell wall-associated NlpC family hydrolase